MDRSFPTHVEHQDVLPLARALFAAVGDPAAFAGPSKRESGDADTADTTVRFTIETWEDGPRRVALDYRVYDDDGRGGGGDGTRLTVEGFADGTRLLLRGLGSVSSVEVVHDGGLGVRLVDAASSWVAASVSWTHVLHPSLPAAWGEAARRMRLDGGTHAHLGPSDVILGDVDGRRFAAYPARTTLLHYGPVPRATPAGRLLRAESDERRPLPSASDLFALVVGRPLVTSPELQDLRVSDCRGLLGNVWRKEEATERWRSDGWTLRASRNAVATGEASKLADQLQLALQHDDGEPVAAFLDMLDSPVVGPRENRVSVYLHGAPDAVEPVAARVRAWLAERGWHIWYEEPTI